MTPLTIRLDPKLEKALDRIAKSSGRTKSEIAREALRRQVAVARFRELRKKRLPFAEAQGLLCADLPEVILLEHELVVGQNVLRELNKALRDKIKLPATRSSEIVEFVADEAAVVINGALPVEAKVDADDALVLGEARRGQAEMFVTGDAALSKRGTVEGLGLFLRASSGRRCPALPHENRKVHLHRRHEGRQADR
jgi:hypothetical protein